VHPTLRSNSVMGLKRFVRSTNGVTFIGAGLPAALEIEANLVALDLSLPLCKTAQVRLVVRQGRPLSVAASRLLVEMQENFSVFDNGRRSAKPSASRIDQHLPSGFLWPVCRERLRFAVWWMPQ
jgi:hypothetical protein